MMEQRLRGWPNSNSGIWVYSDAIDETSTAFGVKDKKEVWIYTSTWNM